MDLELRRSAACLGGDSLTHPRLPSPEPHLQLEGRKMSIGVGLQQHCVRQLVRLQQGPHLYMMARSVFQVPVHAHHDYLVWYRIPHHKHDLTLCTDTRA